MSAHPQLRLPYNKEAHVFDAEDFDDGADTAAIDARFAGLFAADAGISTDVQYGDATPISIFLPQCIHRIARYNPAMRWIVLLREPAERALSHYRMERTRGWEHWPLWPAPVSYTHLDVYKRQEPQQLRGLGPALPAV